MTGPRKLAEAVLLKALADAQKGDPEALKWLTSDVYGFRFWSDVLGAPQETVRAYLLKQIDGGPLTQAKRARQALIERPELSNTALSRKTGIPRTTISEQRRKLKGEKGKAGS